MRATWEDHRDPLAALREGDPEPFEAFVRTELPTFLGFFRRLGAAPAEAEDLAQELFLRMFRHAPTYQRQGRFAAYAFRVARNLWIDRSRRLASQPARGRGRAEDGDEAVERVPDRRQGEPSEQLTRREGAARMRAALAQLPDHQRLVFELGVLQELPYQEVGAILDVPVGTVKSRMFHAVRRLRAVLGEAGSESEVAPGSEPESGRSVPAVRARERPEASGEDVA